MSSPHMHMRDAAVVVIPSESKLNYNIRHLYDFILKRNVIV